MFRDSGRLYFKVTLFGVDQIQTHISFFVLFRFRRFEKYIVCLCILIGIIASWTTTLDHTESSLPEIFQRVFRNSEYLETRSLIHGLDSSVWLIPWCSANTPPRNLNQMTISSLQGSLEHRDRAALLVWSYAECVSRVVWKGGGRHTYEKSVRLRQNIQNICQHVQDYFLAPAVNSGWNFLVTLVLAVTYSYNSQY